MGYNGGVFCFAVGFSSTEITATVPSGATTGPVKVTTPGDLRSGDAPGSVPLLGIQSNEIASIPFFAKNRVDSSTTSMTLQPEDPINTQIGFRGNGTDEVVYCGVWLDLNDTTNKRFPLDPTSDPGGVTGPFKNQLFTVQQLVTGLHYCLVTEIFFWPPGTMTDPIPVNSTPASSVAWRSAICLSILPEIRDGRQPIWCSTLLW